MTHELEKQAFKNPFKNMKFFKGKKSTGDREKAFTPPKKEDVKLFNKSDAKKADLKQIKQKGFTPVGDAALWGIGKIPKKGPQWKANTANFLAEKKRSLQETDAHFAGKVKDSLGIKRGGLLDKVTSKTHQVPIGTAIKDGEVQNVVMPGQRVDSFTAPINHATKIGLPMLGAAKLMEMTEIEDTSHEPNDPIPAAEAKKEADKETEKESTREQLAYAVEEGLLKQAALDKISTLRKELDRKDTMIKVAKHERDVLLNDSLRFQDESEFYKKAYLQTQKELEEANKKIESIKKEEALSERTKTASDLSEKFLEHGIIKQANVKEFEEFLKTCDDNTFEVFNKIASDSEKGLEKELYIIDDIDKPAHKYASDIGIVSSSGQTMAEAVADLLK